MIQLLILLLGVGAGGQESRKPEATSLLGRPLYAPAVSVERRASMEKDFAAAQAAVDRSPEDPDAIVWLGRRTAYLGRYTDAIAVFSRGVEKHPSDPRMLRHRGHRYISVRQFDKAVADLSKAAALVATRPDEVEPDGQPNEKNIPTSTLKTNIYYHLGLAHYLRGEFDKAADAYRLCMQHSKNADMQVATAHWQYMTLRRLGREAEAQAVLAPITQEMPIIENASYHRLLMMYKGATDPAALLAASRVDGIDAVTIGYGVANWHLYNGRRDDARTILTEITDKYAATQWPAFGYVAAEADLARLR